MGDHNLFVYEVPSVVRSLKSMDVVEEGTPRLIVWEVRLLFYHTPRPTIPLPFPLPVSSPSRSHNPELGKVHSGRRAYETSVWKVQIRNQSVNLDRLERPAEEKDTLPQYYQGRIL